MRCELPRIVPFVGSGCRGSRVCGGLPRARTVDCRDAAVATAGQCGVSPPGQPCPLGRGQRVVVLRSGAPVRRLRTAYRKAVLIRGRA
jgi:hypothetical protein